MRKRFRGNYPVAISPELEGGGKHGRGLGESSGQLYAGKPFYTQKSSNLAEDTEKGEKSAGS